MSNRLKTGKAWCEAEGYQNDLVTEAKTLRFLQTMATRVRSNKGRKPVASMPIESSGGSDEEEDEEEELQTVGLDSLLLYVASLVDLWKVQVSVCNQSFKRENTLILTQM